MKGNITQLQLIMEYFKNHQNKDISHKEIVKWLVSEYEQRTGGVFADPDRGIRSLFQQGLLVKVSKGVYRYDPDFVIHRELEDFSDQQKDEILKRDNYRCVICGKGRQNGVELHIDHIKPKDLGGKATIENGQTLCAAHNFKKKNLGQTETGKKMFIHLYDLAKNINDDETLKFCKEVLEVYERNNINGHIVWKK